MAYKHFKTESGCPWCGCTDVVVEDHPTLDEYIHATCEWCGTSGPAIDGLDPRKGLTPEGTALEAWETRRTWDETLKRLKEN